jgi:hypothetical protein
MIAARNRLIHGYDSVDFDILWAIIKHDLPDLIVRLEKILGNGWHYVDWLVRYDLEVGEKELAEKIIREVKVYQ